MTYRSFPNGFAILILLLCGTAIHAQENTSVLIVDLFLNQQHMGDTFVLQDEDGDFFVEEAVLDDWEISKPWPVAIAFRGERYYAVHDFPGSTTDLKTRDMRLFVTMSPSLMPTRTVDLSSSDMAPRSDGFGLFMDYQLNWLSHQNTGQRTTNALLQPVVFGNFGSIAANTIYRHNSGFDATSGQINASGLSVLELTYTRDDPLNLRSLRIGDIFASSGSQGRALRIGGIQLATNFDTQPSFITYPLPRFYGETSVPTALDVYVNGQLQHRQNVEPGSYVLEDVPVVNGAGQLQVVTRDALGRQQIFTQDFYSATELLREGLSDYSVTIGALREDFGLRNFRYGELAASGTWRHGYRDNLTLEGHGEITHGLRMLGTAANYLIPTGGTISAGLGVSNGNQGTGGKWHIGFRQQSSLLNYTVNVSGATKNFRFVGNYQQLPKIQILASAGKGFDDVGTLGMSIVHQSYYDQQDTTIVTANFSKSFENKLSLTTHVSYIDNSTDSYSVGIRFSLPFGDRYYASGGYAGSAGQDSVSTELVRDLVESQVLQ